MHRTAWINGGQDLYKVCLRRAVFIIDMRKRTAKASGRVRSRRESNRQRLAGRLDLVMSRMGGGGQSVGKGDQERQARERGPSGRDKKRESAHSRNSKVVKE